MEFIDYSEEVNKLRGFNDRQKDAILRCIALMKKYNALINESGAEVYKASSKFFIPEQTSNGTKQTHV